MSTPTPLPTQTPNVVIRSPRLRTLIYDIYGIAGLALFCVIAADAAAPQFDLSAFTTPAFAVYGILGAGIGYTARQNTPGS